MAEISLDEDTRIVEMDESTSADISKKTSDKKEVSHDKVRSVVVTIPLDKIRDGAEASKSINSSKNVNSRQDLREKLAVSKQKTDPSRQTVDKVPPPLPVPNNYNIPRRQNNEEKRIDEKVDSSRARSRSPARRSRSPAHPRGSSPVRRGSSREYTPPRFIDHRTHRSPGYRGRYSPSRSRSRESYSRFDRSPRRRSPAFNRSPYRSRQRRSRSPVHNLGYSRSPNREFRGRYSRSPDRGFGPPDHWMQRGDRFQDNPMNFPGNQDRSRYMGFERHSDHSRGPDYAMPMDFATHSEQWRYNPNEMNYPRREINPPRTDLPPPTLPLPQESSLPQPSQSAFDLLKEELKGISHTVLALSTQMKQSTVVKESTKMDSSNGQSEVPASPQSDQTTPSSSRLVQSMSIVQSEESSKLPQDQEEREESESEEDSSDDESGSEAGSSEEEDTPPSFNSSEGILDWPTLVQHIIQQFPDKISPEESGTAPTGRIGNLGGMSERKESERVRLPMYPPIRKEMSLFPSDIRNPPNKARAKRDTQPLARGSFPDSEKGLPVQALSDCLHFNQPCQVDSGVEKLLPSKKNTFSIQGRFSEENLRKMERDLKVSLSSLSYVTWSMDFATQYLIRLSEKKKKRDTYLPVVSALKHALSFLTSVVDRSSTTLATTILARRDSYLSQMDDIIPEEDLISLRSADFMDHRLFAGTIADIVPKLDSLRKDNQSRESVDALASLAKKSVQGSSKTSASNNSSSKKKQSNKKFNKQKKSSKPTGSYNSGASTSTTTTEANKSSGITRTFRAKGKKGGKK